MLAKFAIGLAVLFGALLVVVVVQPAEFRLARHATIAAPADVVFAQLNDFRKWPAWSPWEKMDPNLQRVYGDATAGVGGTYAWKGSGGVGEGRMTITESTPGERLALTLEFTKPMVATNHVEFALTPAPGGVDVTWSMAGRNGFIGKVLSLVVGMDKMVGKEFEKGLADLKAVAEAQV